MKKAIAAAVCILTLLLACGCEAKERNEPRSIKEKETTEEMKTKNVEKATKTVFLTNGVTQADVWLLPETKENLKTTLWGKATAAAVKTDETRPIPLGEPGGEGFYMFRMIDKDGYYYSANGVVLETGWTLTIREDEANSVILSVTDENGAAKSVREVFAAKL